MVVIQTKNELLNFFRELLSQKLEDINNLQDISFSEAEIQMLNFLSSDFSYSIDNLKFDNINFYLYVNFLKLQLKILTNTKKYFDLLQEKKRLYDYLVKFENKKNEIYKIREKLILGLSENENSIIAKKFITQTIKYEQEIPHIAQLEVKRKNGKTITKQERDNLIFLENSIKDDKEWCDVFLSNFSKKFPDVISKIRTINKKLDTLLKKEGEILYYIDDVEKEITDLQINKNFLTNEKKQEVVNEITAFIDNYMQSNNISDIIVNDTIFFEKYFEQLKNFLTSEKHIIKIQRKPINILFVPFIDDSIFINTDKLFILPIYLRDEYVLKKAFANLKWEIDEEEKINFIRKNKNYPQDKIKEKYIQFYITKTKITV